MICYSSETFAGESNTNNGSSTRRQLSPCVIYAVIKEEHNNAYITVCAGHERLSHVYTSTSNIVQIHIVTKKQPNEDLPKFLFKYEGIEKL